MKSGTAYTDFDKQIEEAFAAEGESMPESATLVDQPKQKWGRGLGRPPVTAKEYDGNSEVFHNSKAAKFEDLPEYFARNYKKEKYEHRIMAYLKAQGLSNKEIAERTDYCYGAVCQIMQLPWVKQVIRDEIKRNGQDAVETLITASTFDSVMTLIAVRDNPNSQNRDKITASKELLDRAYGKACQPITYKEEKDLSKLTDEELAKVVASGGRAN